MKNSLAKSVVGFIVALISVLGINFIPLEMWLDDGFSGETLMIIYAIENTIAFIIGIPFVLLFAPRRDKTSKIKTRREILQLYLLLGAAFSVGNGIFLCAFIFLVLRTQVDFLSVQAAVIWIFAFQIVLFIVDFIMLRPLNLLQAQLYLNRSLGRIFFLFICVFVGIAIALFTDKWFVLPFIVLKTLIDIAEQIQTFTGIGKTAETVNSLTEKY